MLIYILKSAACMAIFFFFYKLLLEKENMHVFKRIYLLLALVASIAIPTLVFTEYVVVQTTPIIKTLQVVANDIDNIVRTPALKRDALAIKPLLWMVYFLGFTFFGLKFIKNLFKIISRIRQNPKQKSRSFVQVLIKESFPPHTFFKYIFLNEKKLKSNQIPNEVLLHEETHALQKHSCDVVFIELLQVFLWFNPLIYLFKRAIKLNHEFLADQAVLNRDIDKATYQNTLLSYLTRDSQNTYPLKMANAITYSSIKKRFTIMKTHTSKKAILFRSLLLLPLLALLLLGFSKTALIEVTSPIINEISLEASPQELIRYNKLANKYNLIAIEERKISLEHLEFLEIIFRKMSTAQKKNGQPFPEYFPKNIQDGASKELVKEYNKLAKHYNEMPLKKMKIVKKDVERLEYIYGLMSDKQKADAQPFPDFPEPPTPLKAPREPEFLTEKEEVARIIKKTIEEQDPYDVVGSNIRFTHPSKGELREQLALREKLTQEREAKLIARRTNAKKPEVPAPPIPPKPISPLDHVVEMAKNGATFYYEGEKVSSEQAIELLKNDESLNINSSGSKSNRPVVKISRGSIDSEN